VSGGGKAAGLFFRMIRPALFPYDQVSRICRLTFFHGRVAMAAAGGFSAGGRFRGGLAISSRVSSQLPNKIVQ